jgi:hypothetical protein
MIPRMEFTLLILTLLCRLAPVQAAMWIVSISIDWAIGVLEDEDHRAWLDADLRNARQFGCWLAFIEGWLDVLIAFETHRLMGRRWLVRKPRRHEVASIRTAGEAFNRLVLICDRYCDFQRLARLRAVKLARMFDALDPLGRIDCRPAGLSLEEALEEEAVFAIPPTKTLNLRIRGPPSIGDSSNQPPMT